MKHVALATFMLLPSSIGFSEARRPDNIAVVLDMQSTKQVYLETRAGIRAAMEVLRSTGHEPIVKFFDSHGNGVVTKHVMEHVITLKPDVIIGEIDSDKALIAGYVAEAAHQPMITPFATSPGVTKNRSYIFRGCFSDAFQGAMLGQFARNHLKLARAAILYDKSHLYSSTLRNEFAREFTSLGGKIVADVPVLSTEGDFSGALDQIQRSHPDFIFVPLYEETVAKILAEGIRRHSLKDVPLIGGDGWAAGAIFGKLVADKKSELTAYWVLHHDPRLAGKATEVFLRAYEKVTGSLPMTSAAYLAYDSVMVAHAALLNAKDRDPDSFVAAIKKLNFTGVSGRSSYNGFSDPSKSLFMMKFDGHKSTFLNEMRP